MNYKFHLVTYIEELYNFIECINLLYFHEYIHNIIMKPNSPVHCHAD